ncbi:MAG: hypothetical protein JXB32_03845 [Deltaproteobacteria bacterium]|nr:hypothetical protein [Deltaproteobacteria bacterium]
MTGPAVGVEQAIADAVRIIDEGVDYGHMGIDAPAEVGRRAAEVLAPVVALHPDNLNLRCVYAATVSLSGRLADAREQLGMILERDASYFEAVAELDHPSAWRHVFLSPPWSTANRALPPLMQRWLLNMNGVHFASLREGADRVVGLLGPAPRAVLGLPDPEHAPIAIDATLLTRTAGAFLAIHVGIGGPDPEHVVVLDGFEFPWPEGTGFRSELLLRYFLQQDHTYLILSRPSGTVLLNRLVRFDEDDRLRHDRFLRRLEAATPRDTDTRLQQAIIGRYFEEFSRTTLRNRLAYRLRQGHPSPEQLAGEDPDVDGPRSPPERVQTMPSVPRDARPAADVAAKATPPEGAPAREQPDSAPPRTRAPTLSPMLHAGLDPDTGRPLDPEERAARSGLAIAGLWPWARRERWFSLGAPLLVGVGAVLGFAVASMLGTVDEMRLAAGGLLGVAVAILAVGIYSAHGDRSLQRHLERLIASSGGAITTEALAEANRLRGAELLPGPAGARLRRRLARMLAETPAGADRRDGPAPD